MDFYEVLNEVLVLLRQHGRVSHRALKRQFNLDDDFIDDLKEELLHSRHPVADEDGQSLVWTGDLAASEPSSTTTQPAQPGGEQEYQPTQAEAAPSDSSIPDAERRQLTVMFCDLVDSTPLSEQLDPEDLRQVVRAYQQTCTEVVRRFDGHVAQLLGDALLVYFGWPQAHEDDAQRAARTGLGMLDAMGTLNTRLEREKGIRLAIRVGIHTGLVVVGEMGSGGHEEQLALGDTPNIASRIQGIAEPDTVAISEATYRLIEGYFTCQMLGKQSLKGVGQLMPVYRVLSESGAQSRLDVVATRGLTPLVGREQEVGLLLERWRQVKEGQGQVILLSGEAGIGKSRLVQVLKDRVADDPHTRLECRSSPYYQNTAFYPLVDLTERVAGFQRHDTPEVKLEKLEKTLRQYTLPLAETVPLYARLLSLPLPEERYPPLNWSPQQQRQKTLQTIVAILLEQAEQLPVLFILEDLHWTDPSTLELLHLLIDQTPTAALGALLTCRPAFQPPWSSRSYLTLMTLNRLSHGQIAHMTERVAGGKRLPDGVLQQIVEKTDGVPLYVEEMTKAVLESGMLQEIDGQYALTGPLSALAIPATLRDSLMARLDRLVSAKGIAQLGATIGGRQFSYELLQAVSQLDDATLQRQLGQLIDAELLYQRGLPPQATYTFKHALIRDTAYHALLKSTRQHYHQRIAQVLTQRFPEMANTQPELLAHHYTDAGLNEPAARYWQQAGQHASERSAYVEAIAHLTKGLEALKTLPETSERAQRELDLHTMLGPALMVTKGQAAPDVERVYARARELCQQVGDTPQLFPVLWGLWYFYLARGALQTARELGEQLVRLGQHLQDRARLIPAHRALGNTLLWLGEMVPACTHLEQGVALYDPQQHRTLDYQYGQNLAVVCGAWASWARWILGYPEQALAHIKAVLAHAQGLDHPLSRAYALNGAAWLYQWRGETQAAQERAEAGMALCKEQGFALYLAWLTVLRGWTVATQGQREAGMIEIRQGLDAWRATGAELSSPYFLALLAEAYAHIGQPQEGLACLREALTVAAAIEERLYAAELYRLQGELLHMGSVDQLAEAEASFQLALSVAQTQHAKSWELRAATSLARLWQSQDRRQEAYDLLAPVYAWFTEGFGTADLQDAKALLEELL